MDYQTLRIDGQNIYLVCVSMDRKEEIFKEFNPDITTYMYPAPATQIEHIENFIESSINNAKNNEDFTFMVIKKDDDSFLGCGGVHNLKNETPEFGIWIKKSAHGNHYGFEAIQTAFNFFKTQYKQFVYPVDQRNIASKKIPLKLGGTYLKSYDKKTMDGRTLQIEEYIIKA